MNNMRIADIAVNKVNEHGFSSLNAREFKAYVNINWSFSSYEEYQKKFRALSTWAKENLDSQKLFKTKDEFIRIVNKALHKYKRANKNRITFSRWNEDKDVDIVNA